MKKKLFWGLLAMAISVPMSAFAADASVLTITEGTPNPNGSLDAVYLFKGDGIDGEISLVNTEILPEKASDADTTLYVYHINDIHGNIMSYSAKGDTYNLAQMKTMVDTSKATVNDMSSTLFVTAGDDHIGSKLDELLGNSVDEFTMSASFTAYSEAGMDFIALGNHEFDKYTPTLAKMIEENATFPVILSNIFGSAYDLNTSVAAIGVVDGLRVGVLGLTVTDETNLGTVVDPTLYGVDPIETVEKLVPIIDEYCDFILVLSHNGYEVSERYTITAGDGAIAAKVGELTDTPAVVVGGHTHTILNPNGLSEANVHNGVPTLQAGQYGLGLGKFYANLKDETPVYNARILPVLSGVPTADGTILQTEDCYDVAFQNEVIEPMNALVEEVMAKEVGTTDDTELLMKETNLVDRYIGESAMANYFNDAIVARSQTFTTGEVDFSIFNSTGISGLETNATITYNDIYNLFPYADTISTVQMKGSDLKEIIENNAPRVIDANDLTTNGGDLDPSSFIETGYLNFSSGIRYQIQDGSAINITLNGVDIDEVLDEEYAVAISTYLVIGRGGWQGEAVGQGLPDDFIGYDLKTICSENGLDLGLLFRGEIVSYIVNDCDGYIGAETGVIKDGRVEVLS